LSQGYVLYWMQQAQRVEDNKALIEATREANNLGCCVKVVFCLTDSFPDANYRHYRFMFEGLVEVETKLIELGYDFEIITGVLPNSLESFITSSLKVYTDLGYLKIHSKWRDSVRELCEKQSKEFFIVETEVIVPVELVSNKQEYMAWTFRKKITPLLEEYLIKDALPELKYKKQSDANSSKISSLKYMESYKESDYLRQGHFIGGISKANCLWREFVTNKLSNYSNSNDPSLDLTSKLSPYLHFGQVSTKNLVLEVLEKKKELENEQTIESFDNFLEQIIVRRELAINNVYYNKGYDRFESMTNDWAYKTMKKHAHDKREYIYSLKDFENLKTHDLYWNAAMKEMVITGYMHNYMRMYWCKKIIEWSKCYQEAYDMAIYFNNKYFLDGRDANSYTGVAWCFGLHDRGWTERPVLGKLRYMNSNGLRRKFDIDNYVKRINKL